MVFSVDRWSDTWPACVQRMRDKDGLVMLFQDWPTLGIRNT